ncbi:helix-turn-helix transcriptional regulator [Kistimonas scapharcae]
MRNKMQTLDTDIEKILFPEGRPAKHPYSRELVALNEQQGRTLSEMASATGVSQPFISQIKAGKGKLKDEHAQILIRMLYPKAPRDQFSAYPILKAMTPSLPDNWEQQVLMEGLRAVSEHDSEGRYPTGEAGFNEVLSEHSNVLELIDSDGSPKKQHGLGFSSQAQIERSNRSVITQLEDALATYHEEVTKLEREESLEAERLERAIVATWYNLTKKRHDDDLTKLKLCIEDVIEQKFQRYGWSPAIPRKRLTDACTRARGHLEMPMIKKLFESGNDENVGGNEKLYDPEAHAKRLLAKCKELQEQFDAKRSEHRQRFRLTGHASPKALRQLKDEAFSDPRDASSMEDWGKQLFGDAVIRVYRRPNKFYEINLSKAYRIWFERHPRFSYQEEVVQICGPLILQKAFAHGTLIVHELHSRQFVVLRTIQDERINKKLTILSKPLSVEGLFSCIKDESLMQGWSIEQWNSVADDLQTTLLTKGYRVPGVRSIY